MNPFGLLYSEVTASCLVAVDLEGHVVDPGSTQLGINKPGYGLHAAIHAARSDVKCVVHVHTNAGVAVSETHVYSCMAGSGGSPEARACSYEFSNVVLSSSF